MHLRVSSPPPIMNMIGLAYCYKLMERFDIPLASLNNSGGDSLLKNLTHPSRKPIVLTEIPWNPFVLVKNF